uniref:NADH-ubiquinone oxidoreductase chain 4 n=1 Tax=Spinolyprops cribricollis TaxID=2984372 RepID=A0A978B0M1_9CUCU|nr:NADH dehydrogenase subunit 4 [Spinolyprops cribricollis]UYB79064.1 NADH dehydrogenase subunit 4 [Spinolyprops cribricollis]
MMKFIFMMMFMVPMGFFGWFWFIHYIMFILMFVFIFSFQYTGVEMLGSEMGIDLLSYMLILLSFWICSLMFTSMESVYTYKMMINLFTLIMMILTISLILTFSFLNLFLFYLFFEVSLIPIFILVVGWGYQPERMQAGFYLLIYTLMASLPMMISLFYLYKSYNSLMIFNFFQINEVLIYLMINMVFFIKIPMFFVHLWLPKAHVEAPVAGSMILAGIMLKLGGYGLFRFMISFMSLGLKINSIFLSICMVGGFYVSLICIRQSDMKSLIAYSSVSHMSLVLGGVLTLNFWGGVGGLVMMIAHGLCSSGLFCLANISYERVGSRSLYLNKGLINIIPSLSLIWFLLISCNMAAPPSFNLVGEIMLINSLIGYSSLNMIFLMLISFFSAVYSLFLYSFSQHGNVVDLYSLKMCNVREFYLLFMHWLPLNLMILGGDMFFCWV